MKTDIIAEKAVLSAIYNYGSEVYYDVCDVIQQSNTFTVKHNEYFYLCLQNAFEKENVTNPDIATIYTSAKNLGLTLTSECQNHINQIIDFPTEKTNVRSYASRIRKLKIAELLDVQLDLAKNELGDISGDETVSEIIGIAENKIFDFSALLSNVDSQPESLGEGILELLKDRMDNPVEQVGLSSGFGRFDKSIGGGLRPSSVTVIAARTKGFKSGLGLNIGRHVSSLEVPVLYVDTELTKSEQQFRLASSLSDVHIEDIETGQVKNDDAKLKKLREGLRKSKEYIKHFDHMNVANLSFEDQISTMRRWLFKNPGIQLSGKANPCLIIFDYIKIIDSVDMKDMAEYQRIGFMTSTLHNFAVKYNVPILTFIQLNRDGITREDSSAISQSDRVAWFCSSASIFKPKGEEEISAEENAGISNAGNFKIVPLHCRHGAGLKRGDYINVHIKGECFKATEGNLHSENLLLSKYSDYPESEIEF